MSRGCALVAAGQSVVVQVILVKDDPVFLNDGIYGSFQEIQISKNLVTCPSRVIRPGGQPSAASRPFSLLSGPTCDSLDILPGKIDLPQDIAVGDWIEFGSVGAYSNAMATRFNGFEPVGRGRRARRPASWPSRRVAQRPSFLDSRKVLQEKGDGPGAVSNSCDGCSA